MRKTCKQCGYLKEYNEFEKSESCKDGYRQTCRDCRAKNRKIHKCVCLKCNKTFMSQRKNTKYCSRGCSGKARRATKTVQCSCCGKDKQIIPSLKERLKDFYCNQECRNKHLHKIMGGENNPNYKSIEYICDGCKKIIKVKPYQVKTQKNIFCCNDCYKKNIGKFYSGKDNPNWNSELSELDRKDTRRYPEYYRWREKVYERDGYTCSKCKDNTSGNLIAHHIYNYSEHKSLRTEINNGITLCVSCHLEYHNLYGYKGNNAKQLKEFFD